jgi:hypothetical protein
VLYLTSFAFLYALNTAPANGWTSGRILSAFALSAVFLFLVSQAGESVQKSV